MIIPLSETPQVWAPRRRGVQDANGVLNQIHRNVRRSSSRLQCRGGLQRAHGFENPRASSRPPRV